MLVELLEVPRDCRVQFLDPLIVTLERDLRVPRVTLLRGSAVDDREADMLIARTHLAVSEERSGACEAQQVRGYTYGDVLWDLLRSPSAEIDSQLFCGGPPFGDQALFARRDQPDLAGRVRDLR